MTISSKMPFSVRKSEAGRRSSSTTASKRSVRWLTICEAFFEDVTIGIAYGRMEGRQLEKVMLDFYQGKYDVLLCTTLIENGLDQPNANTMLVYDADRLGLSQIYQMRGRVGRSEKIARAWFFYRAGEGAFRGGRKTTGYDP